MNTTKRITTKQLAELVYNLMVNLPDETDMQIIESAVNQVLKHNELRFKPYFEMLNSADEKYLITKCDTTSEYFFDAINSKGIYLDKVEYLINLTINF
jgi:hypothetical protein